jgi:hypothetical protein
MKMNEYNRCLNEFLAIKWVDFESAAAAFMSLVGSCNVPPDAALKRVESVYAQQIPQEEE